MGAPEQPRLFASKKETGNNTPQATGSKALASRSRTDQLGHPHLQVEVTSSRNTSEEESLASAKSLHHELLGIGEVGDQNSRHTKEAHISMSNKQDWQ